MFGLTLTGVLDLLIRERSYTHREASYIRAMNEFEKEIQMSLNDTMNTCQPEASQSLVQSPTNYVRERAETDLKIFKESRENLKSNIADFQKQLADVELAISSITALLDVLGHQPVGGIKTNTK